MTKKNNGRSFWDLVAEQNAEQQPTPAFDPAVASDELDNLTEYLSGFRNKLITAGFNETAAEQMCVQQHYLLVLQATQGQ